MIGFPPYPKLCHPYGVKGGKVQLVINVSLSLRSDYREQRAKHPRSKIIMRVSQSRLAHVSDYREQKYEKIPLQTSIFEKNTFFENFSTFEGTKRGFLRLYNISHR